MQSDPVIRALQDRVATLEEAVLQLRTAMRQPGNDWEVPFCLGLTRTQACVLCILMEHKVASPAALVSGAYGIYETARCIKTLHVFISAIRRKLRPHGVTIHSRKGIGWMITPADKQKLRSIED